MNRFLTTGALAVTAAGLLASSAQAAGPNTCVYNPATKNVSVKLAAGGFVELDREGNKFVTFDAFGKTVCASPTGTVATIGNTAAIFMVATVPVGLAQTVLPNASNVTNLLPSRSSSTNPPAASLTLTFLVAGCTRRCSGRRPGRSKRAGRQR